MAYLLKPGAEPQEIQPAKGGKFSLKELQGYVGGYIELLFVPDYLFLRNGGKPYKGEVPKYEMIINEEGKIYKLPVNPLATKMALPVLHPDDQICGPVVIGTHEEFNA